MAEGTGRLLGGLKVQRESLSPNNPTKRAAHLVDVEGGALHAELLEGQAVAAGMGTHTKCSAVGSAARGSKGAQVQACPAGWRTKGAPTVTAARQRTANSLGELIGRDLQPAKAQEQEDGAEPGVERASLCRR